MYHASAQGVDERMVNVHHHHHHIIIILFIYLFIYINMCLVSTAQASEERYTHSQMAQPWSETQLIFYFIYGFNLYSRETERGSSRRSSLKGR